MKKYNFNAGPSMLPREVIENTAKQCLDFNGSGLSLMEISHRAKDFQPVVDEAVALVKELLQVPEGYSVIFLGGGASLWASACGSHNHPSPSWSSRPPFWER